MQTGVYKIESPTGKIYIGSSVNIQARFRKYKSLNCKSQTRIYNSLLKYGVYSHKFSIVIECNKDELYEYEHLYSCFYNVLGENGLNCIVVGFKEVKTERSKETIEKHRIKMLGKKLTEEHKQKIRGFKHTDDTKQRIRIAMTNKFVGKETREKLRLKPQKLVVNIESGIFYDSSKDAAFAYNVCKGNLSSMLNGKRKNKTKLAYL